ncbi:hypothetical protein WN944_010538 [Citrus x changshan-huyou]|uniref:Uncharacterized protein n=1 Tax=Citrus x changshan-huyou TaxID=2935761 RepID=A0AAP0MRU9_9ROSI
MVELAKDEKSRDETDAAEAHVEDDYELDLQHGSIIDVESEHVGASSRATNRARAAEPWGAITLGWGVAEEVEDCDKPQAFCLL